MYTETCSKTISEATSKLLKAKATDAVFSCHRDALNDIQKDCLGEYLDWLKPYTDDINLALNNIYVNPIDNHLYVLEMADDGDDNIEYYYYELVPLTTLYKDDLGNLYYDGGLTEDGLRLLILVEEDNGHYIYTHNTWYEDADRLAELYTTIELEVR